MAVAGQLAPKHLQSLESNSVFAQPKTVNFVHVDGLNFAARQHEKALNTVVPSKSNNKQRANGNEILANV